MRQGGELPPWVQRRFDLAIEKQRGEPLVCLSVGTNHKPPPLDDRGFPISECEAGANYLMQRGIPSAQIRLETVSYDTVGNAYFSKILHVDPCGWRSLAVITSEFHMPRSRVMFETVYGLDRDRSYEFDFLAVSDEGLDAEIIEARRGHEQASLRRFQENAKSISSLRDLHDWLYTEHDAYRANLLRGNTDDSAVLRSY